MRKIAIYHNKGGVGKTTTAVNLAYLSARTGHRTLLCDLDPQASASFYFRVKPKFKSGAKGLVKGKKAWEKNIKATDYENLDILPAALSFRHLPIFLKKHPKQKLNRILTSLDTRYDYIFIDCPATMSLLAENIFNAADMVLTPLAPTLLAVRSYLQLLGFFNKKGYDKRKVAVFFNLVENTKTMQLKIMAQFSRQPHHQLETYIPYDHRVEQMTVKRMPLPEFAPDSPSGRAYRELWEELVQRELL